MTNELYTSTACVRCKMTKRYMQEHSIDYTEYDFKAKGKDAFSQFYRAHRQSIFRDEDGVEFPVFTDGTEVRQGVSVIIGYLIAGEKLDGFIDRSQLHGEWIDGIQISQGDPSQLENLLLVLSYLKSNALKIQLTTDGRNASVLEAVLANKLCDRVIMDVKGPAEWYEKLCGQEIDEDELKKSIRLTATASEYEFFTSIHPLEREGGQFDYLTPEEIGETARLIEAATASKKHHYELRQFNPQDSTDDRFKSLDPLPPAAMFKYRTTARRYQVLTEIEK
jgi:pyruvate-formate lyase-activating enzyme